MKVKELRKALNSLPEDAEILVFTGKSYDRCTSIIGVCRFIDYMTTVKPNGKEIHGEPIIYGGIKLMTEYNRIHVSPKEL